MPTLPPEITPVPWNYDWVSDPAGLWQRYKYSAELFNTFAAAVRERGSVAGFGYNPSNFMSPYAVSAIGVPVVGRPIEQGDNVLGNWRNLVNGLELLAERYVDRPGGAFDGWKNPKVIEYYTRNPHPTPPDNLVSWASHAGRAWGDPLTMGQSPGKLFDKQYRREIPRIDINQDQFGVPYQPGERGLVAAGAKGHRPTEIYSGKVLIRRSGNPGAIPPTVDRFEWDPTTDQPTAGVLDYKRSGRIMESDYGSRDVQVPGHLLRWGGPFYQRFNGTIWESRGNLPIIGGDGTFFRPELLADIQSYINRMTTTWSFASIEVRPEDPPNPHYGVSYGHIVTSAPHNHYNLGGTTYFYNIAADRGYRAVGPTGQVLAAAPNYGAPMEDIGPYTYPNFKTEPWTGGPTGRLNLLGSGPMVLISDPESVPLEFLRWEADSGLVPISETRQTGGGFNLGTLHAFTDWQFRFAAPPT
jgi:hypothetical protein